MHDEEPVAPNKLGPRRSARMRRRDQLERDTDKGHRAGPLAHRGSERGGGRDERRLAAEGERAALRDAIERAARARPSRATLARMQSTRKLYLDLIDRIWQARHDSDHVKKIAESAHLVPISKALTSRVVIGSAPLEGETHQETIDDETTGIDFTRVE